MLLNPPVTKLHLTDWWQVKTPSARRCLTTSHRALQRMLSFPTVSPPIILCVSSMFDVTLTGVNTDANMTNQPHTSNTSSPPRAPGFPSEQMDVSHRHQPHTSLPVCLQSMNQTADDEILSQTHWRAPTKEARRSVCVQSQHREQRES